MISNSLFNFFKGMQRVFVEKKDKGKLFGYTSLSGDENIIHRKMMVLGLIINLISL